MSSRPGVSPPIGPGHVHTSSSMGRVNDICTITILYQSRAIFTGANRRHLDNTAGVQEGVCCAEKETRMVPPKNIRGRWQARQSGVSEGRSRLVRFRQDTVSFLRKPGGKLTKTGVEMKPFVGSTSSNSLCVPFLLKLWFLPSVTSLMNSSQVVSLKCLPHVYSSYTKYTR